MVNNTIIRIARSNDLIAVNEIHTQAVRHGALTAHLQPYSLGERREWFQKHQKEGFTVLIAEKESKVVGFGTLSPYRPGREGLKYTGILSYFVDFDHHRSGIGTEIVSALLLKAKQLNYHVLLAIILEGNEGSLRLLKKLNFEQWAYLPQVYRQKDTVLSQIYMGKILD